MRVLPSSLLLALELSFSLPSALAWGSVGHEIVATIAQIHLHPSTASTICDLLPSRANCHLAPVAAWADQVRNSRRYTGPLHYVGAHNDHPSSTCIFEQGEWEGEPGVNVLSAVRNSTAVLEGGWGDHTQQSEALWFLVHFLGDMHMPLHLTGRDRGGNGDKVLFDGRLSNLHSVWDSKLIAKSLRTIPRNYTRPLPSQRIERALRGTIYDPYIRRIMWEGVLGRYKDEIVAGNWTVCPLPESELSREQVVLGSGAKEVPTDDEAVCPFYWAQPIHELNCAIVWPKALDEPPYSHLSSSTPDERHSCSAHEDLDALHDLEDEPLAAMRPRPRPAYLELDTPAYAGAIAREWIIERLLAQAGIRLAAVLNYLYAEAEGKGVKGLGLELDGYHVQPDEREDTACQM